MDKEDLRLLYSVSVSDIQNFKGQQWKVTNYVLLLFAAITSISQLVKNLYCAERTVLCVFTIAVVVVGCYFTKRLHNSIKLRQGRLGLIQDRLGDEFKEIWKGNMSDAQICASKQDVLWLFWSVQIVSAVVVFWLLIRPLI
jgi:hypothetical protein